MSTAQEQAARSSVTQPADIPNRDFILKFDVAGEQMQDAVLATASPAGSKVPGGYFTLILQPPARVRAEDVTPRELIFVLDTSGSMRGSPSKRRRSDEPRARRLCAADTFNLITFSGDTHILFPEPVHATPDNIRKAQEVSAESRSGSGGTEMMKAIRASLEGSDNAGHVRVVCFMTDGEVGNDMEIIAEVQRHPNARVFAFGIGSSRQSFSARQDGAVRPRRGGLRGTQ